MRCGKMMQKGVWNASVRDEGVHFVLESFYIPNVVNND